MTTTTIISREPQVSAQLYNRIRFIERGRRTRRYHAALNMHEYQRIDAHSYGVAMLTTILVPDAMYDRRARLLMAALIHDLPEQFTGDVPAPAKREMGIRETMHEYEDAHLQKVDLLKHMQLNSADKRVLHLADSGDGALHCIAEREMGNMNVEPIFRTFWSYLTDDLKLADVPSPETGEATLRNFIETEWDRVGGKW